MTFVFDERKSDSPFVELVWQTSSERDGTFTSQAVSQWEMVITRFCGETYVTMHGPETKATTAFIPPNAEFLGIQFKLGTFMPKFPLSMLTDGAVTLPMATGRSFWLNGRAWEIPNFENADTFIQRLMRDGLLVRDPLVESMLRGEIPDLSPRAIQYRFANATGMTQKLVQQIQRAREATVMLQQGTPILDTAYSLGYFDQAHLTRSLKRFVGSTPAQVVRTGVLA